MAEATFKHGSPLMVDHTTAGTAIAVGEVVVTGTRVRIAHAAIPANTLGALAAAGGVYLVAKTTGEAWTFAAVYFDESEDEFTMTASGNVYAGFAAAVAGANDTTGMLIHSI